MTGKERLRRLFSDLPVKVLCLAAAVILFMFNRINTLTERFFSVPLRVEVPSGLAIASPYPSTVRITLRGEEQAINPVLAEDIVAAVDLEGRKAPGNYKAQVKVSRTGTALGVEPLEVRVEPQEIAFSLEPLLERRVSVVPDVKGSVAHGYELVGYELGSRAVTIRGPKSRVQAVSSLTTEEIDLTGRTGSFALRVRLVLADPLVKVTADPFVDFKATIQEAIVAKRFESVALEVVDLAPIYHLKGALPNGSVQVQGTQLAIEALESDQVKLVLDCATVRRPGQWTLHPRAEVPSTVQVLDWSPKELIVEIVAGR